MTQKLRPAAASRRRALRSVAAGALLGPLFAPLGLRLAQAAPVERAQALLDALAQATAIQQGKGRHRLYAFFDPNCPFCHRLYVELSPLVASHDLQVQWVVLGMLTSSSPGKAAAMLQAPDRLKAFETNERDYDFAANGQPGGGLLPAATIEPRTRELLQRNLDIYQAHRLFGVPVLVWKRRDGGAGMSAGAPSHEQLLAILAELA